MTGELEHGTIAIAKLDHYLTAVKRAAIALVCHAEHTP